MKRLLALLLFCGASVASALPPVVASYTAVHNAIRVQWSIAGMSDTNACILTVKQGGTTIATITSTSGNGLATRTEYFNGLTPATNYALTIDCGELFEGVIGQPIATRTAPSVPTALVTFQVATPKTYSGGTRASVVFGDTSSLGSSLQNTSCGSGCTISPTLNKGFQYFAIQTQDASNVVLGQTRGSAIVIGDSMTTTLTSGGTGGGTEPPIPRLATWETNMTTYGNVTCNNFVAEGLNTGTYYDGLFSMENIRAYRVAAGAGAPELAQWNACSDIANSVYRSYVLTNFGAVPGYNEFTHGMKMHFARTAEDDSRKGVAYLADGKDGYASAHGAAYCAGDYNTSAVGLQREIAYCMRSILDWAAMGNAPQTSKRATILGHMKTQVAKRIGTRASPTPTELPSPEVALGICPATAPVGKNWYVQPFMLVIQAHSLMQYYDQVSADADILETIKWIADWVVQEAYLPAEKGFWYENCRVSGGATWGAKPAAVDLSLMFVDAFAWLYRKTCDTAYRNIADTLFDEGVRLGSGYLGFDGKHFNQNYAQGSFDYVSMRQLASPTCP